MAIYSKKDIQRRDNEKIYTVQKTDRSFASKINKET